MGVPVRGSTFCGRRGCCSDGSGRGLWRPLALLFVASAARLLLPDFQSERRSSELHIVTLGNGEESSVAAFTTSTSGGGSSSGGIVMLVSIVLRGRGAVRHDLVEVGQVLRRGVEVPDALVVAGSPRVRDVHGTAAVGVEREGPYAAGEAAGERQDEDSSNGAGASSQIVHLMPSIKCSIILVLLSVMHLNRRQLKAFDRLLPNR